MTSESFNILGRCKVKGCGYALFATSEDIKQAEGWRDVRPGQACKVGNWGFYSRCDKGHKVFPLKRVKGTYSKDHKCDSRCLNAKGHECTCSCGGANHGTGHASVVVHEAAQTPVQATRERPLGYDENAITDKQEAFIRRLLDERVVPANPTLTGDERKAHALRLIDNGDFTKRQASATIEWLLTLPRKETV